MLDDLITLVWVSITESYNSNYRGAFSLCDSPVYIIIYITYIIQYIYILFKEVEGGAHDSTSSHEPTKSHEVSLQPQGLWHQLLVQKKTDSHVKNAAEQTPT